MKYCARCVLPDTRPNLVVGADGVCNACRSHASKDAIDWAARAEALREVAAAARARGAPYDCIVPVSGGKDSHWQVLACLEHGLKPLAVTWAPPGRTEIGRRNLENLIGLGVDHVDCRIAPRVERAFFRLAFERHGEPAIPMHMALFAIPLRFAVALGIPLVVWGENSAFEYGGDEEARRGFLLDSRWLRTHGVTKGTAARDWACDEISEKDLAAYRAPSDGEMDRAGVRAVFLGYYLRWDPLRTYEAARAHGFRARAEGAKTGLYDFADIDDDLISVHHWMKWYKFGFTRLFDNLSIEIRNGRTTRDEAIRLLAERGEERPDEDIDRFCAYAGIARARFFEIAEGFRDRRIWTRRGDRWEIPGFLVPDWRWA